MPAEPTARPATSPSTSWATAPRSNASATTVRFPHASRLGLHELGHHQLVRAGGGPCQLPHGEVLSMGWEFETDQAFQEKLDWADAFVREEVEPLDLVWPHEQFTRLEGARRTAIQPLKEEARRQGLWATHLGPELGGHGHGQLKLAVLHQILGRPSSAPL